MADIFDEFLELMLLIDLPKGVCAYLMSNLAEIETRLASGCSEKTQLLALISAFTNSKNILFDTFES